MKIWLLNSISRCYDHRDYSKSTSQFKWFILHTDKLFDSLKHNITYAWFVCSVPHSTINVFCVRLYVQHVPCPLKPKYRCKAHQCPTQRWHTFIRVELWCLLFIYYHLFILHFQPLIISRLRKSYDLMKIKPYKI